MFSQRYRTLPDACYRRARPTPIADPYWLAKNLPLAAELGLSEAVLDALLPVLAGCTLPDGQVDLLAARYSGHQFGYYVPQLGDGRALLLGDVAWQGERAELQLKGAGMTPFSRMGDGRAVLRSSVREYLCSEAMFGLGIPTTRALCLVGSALPVQRETMETAAIVTRVAASFIRFGSFEILAHQNEQQALQALADYVLLHHYPECLSASRPYAALFAAISQRSAALVASWQSVGFCHGVLNSDNMSILGLTLDYGPFGFLDSFDAGHICNHSDHAGRYAYDQQPAVVQWNLGCLAGALLPLVDEDDLLSTLHAFPGQFQLAWLLRMRGKLGLLTVQPDDDLLLQQLLQLLHDQSVDFTLFFRLLGAVQPGTEGCRVSLLFTDPAAWQQWNLRYAARLAAEGSQDNLRQERMRACNPNYILRNYLAEQAIAQARDQHDFSEIARLADCLARPYDEQPDYAAYATLPPAWAQTICLSCSS